ncbi:Cof-type HAD-IIB family hydrolase [Ammoniphilus sp. 3BR4]|uniref:Cof-type HAD-IIB family hydrolase n=1 Tax=Ammoniphilus sp. 3BR4 TaxID=3158265 RepID=UPI003467B0D6
MAYKIVFFDIDGTLVNEDKKIPSDTKQAIQQLKERNVQVVIATGRGPFHLKPIAEDLGIDSFVSFNGSYVVYKGETILERPINASTLELLDACAYKKKHPIVYFSNIECHTSNHLHPHVKESFESLRVTIPSYHPHYWKEAKVYQAMLKCQDFEEEYYLKGFLGLNFVRWHRVSLDVIPAGGSKAKGIEAVLQHLEISPQEAVAFGDALNDREMLSYVGMGIAMGNAHQELKPFADFITKPVNEGGIRYGLQEIGLI